MKPNVTLKALVLLSFLLFTTLAGRSALAQDVRYNFDRDADFTKYKTYK